MTSQEKIAELKNFINQNLLPLIDNNYIFLDLPYYNNIGDVLIWQGTLDFLKQVPYKCLYATDCKNYNKQKLNKETIILLQGGGNWGDLYEDHQEFRKKVIQEFPQNKVIVLPQSIHYQDSNKLQTDIAFFKVYPNVTICTRDNQSFELASRCFPNNNVLLVPDMAFHLEASRFTTPNTIHNNKTLYFKRKDDEFNTKYRNICIPKEADVSDWPTFEHYPLKYLFIDILFGVPKRIIKNISPSFSHRLMDYKRKWFFKDNLIKIGIIFLNQYKTIYTTRLHAMILGILLDKQIHVIDNSYGKNFSYYDTWLSNLDNVNKHIQS